MALLYGKVRIYGDAGQTITITDGKGNSRTIQTTGQNFTDVVLVGLEEYTLSNGSLSADVLLNIGDFKEVDLPVITLETATWAQVKELIQNGNISNIASIGDTKSFVMNGKTYHAEVVVINDGTGDASQWYPANTVDFICKELYETKYRYNATNDNSGGFQSSEIKTTLNSTIYPLLPSDLKSVITAKSHSYQAGSYSSSWSSSMVTSSDNLWLPTYYEIAGGSAQYVEGENVNNNKPYTLDSKIKMVNGESSASGWWLGSPYTSSNYNFWWVNTSGNFGGSTTSYAVGVPLCFRIG